MGSILAVTVDDPLFKVSQLLQIKKQNLRGVPALRCWQGYICSDG